MRRYALGAFALAATMIVAAPVRADVSGGEAQRLLAELASSPEQPDAYKAQVAVRIRMRVFPFLHMTLHGQSEYTKPGQYHFVIRDAPLLAKPWSDVRYDLGDPTAWPQRYDVAVAPSSTSAAPVLRMTPHEAKLVKYVEVTLDAQARRITRMSWMRTDGGVIALTQRYTPVGARQVIAHQDASIDLPVFKASVEASYDGFDETSTK